MALEWEYEGSAYHRHAAAEQSGRKSSWNMALDKEVVKTQLSNLITALSSPSVYQDSFA